MKIKRIAMLVVALAVIGAVVLGLSGTRGKNNEASNSAMVQVSETT